MTSLFFFLVGFSVAASLYSLANQKLIDTINALTKTLEECHGETLDSIHELNSSLMNLRI